MMSKAPSQVHLLGRVLKVERDLREMIRTVFEHEREDWETLIPSSFRTRLQSDRESAQVPWGPERSSELLDFASLGMLADILAGRWKFFQDVFGEKPILMAKLDELRLFRNAIAHGAELSPDDQTRLRLLVEDVERRIPELVKQRTNEEGRNAETPTITAPSNRADERDLDSILERVRSTHVRNALEWLLTAGGFRLIGGYPQRVTFPIALRIRGESGMNGRLELGQVTMRVDFPTSDVRVHVQRAEDVAELTSVVAELGQA